MPGVLVSEKSGIKLKLPHCVHRNSPLYGCIDANSWRFLWYILCLQRRFCVEYSGGGLHSWQSGETEVLQGPLTPFSKGSTPGNFHFFQRPRYHVPLFRRFHAIYACELQKVIYNVTAQFKGKWPLSQNYNILRSSNASALKSGVKCAALWKCSVEILFTSIGLTSLLWVLQAGNQAPWVDLKWKHQHLWRIHLHLWNLVAHKETSPWTTSTNEFWVLHRGRHLVNLQEQKTGLQLIQDQDSLENL